MTRPSREQFDEAIAALSNFHARELLPETLTKHKFFRLDEERNKAFIQFVGPDIAEYFYATAPRRDCLLEATKRAMCQLVERVQSTLDGKRAAFESLPAWKWIESRPAMQRIHRQQQKTKRNKNEPSTRSAWNEHTANNLLSEFNDLTFAEVTEWCANDRWWRNHLRSDKSIFEYLAEKNTQGNKQADFARRVVSFIAFEPFQWHSGILIAFRDYFFTDRWERLYLEYRNREQQLQTALDAMKTLASLPSEYLVDAGARITYWRAYRESKIEEVERALKAGISQIYPIRKKDDTAPERILIYDLYRNDAKHHRRGNAKLIFELVSEEVDRLGFDLRSVQKYIARWSSAERTYRQNLRYLEQKSAMAEKRKLTDA